jgi:peptidyl-prolyl cis-trans isomerase B (cyclophilin B)
VANKKQRQRQLARARYQRRLQQEADRLRRNKRMATGVLAGVAVLAVAGGATALALTVGSSPKSSAAAAAATKTPSASPSASATPSTVPAMVDGKCEYIQGGTAAKKVSLPPAAPDSKAAYTATMKTNRGNIVINLLNSKAPCTVNSFVSLADQGYFNNTPCHRLTTSGIFVLQCGDPSGTGDGTPGYGFGNENLPAASSSGEATYAQATVAMANTGQPDSNGSQFFLVYKNSPLPPDYTEFGTIVSGLNILQNVAKAGSDNSNGTGDGHPKEKVQINSVTIKKA